MTLKTNSIKDLFRKFYKNNSIKIILDKIMYVLMKKFSSQFENNDINVILKFVFKTKTNLIIFMNYKKILLIKFKLNFIK